MNFGRFFNSSQWWGKLFGAFFGYLIAGPAGAFFGILIGNLFDRGLAGHLNDPYQSYYEENEGVIQKTFFETTFSVMGYLAKADGRVSEQEIAMAKAIMAEMHLTRGQRKSAQYFFNLGKESTYNLSQALNTLLDVCSGAPELLKLFVDIQYRITQVDGLPEKKIAVLDMILGRMGFSPLRSQYRFYEDFGYQDSNNSSHSSSHRSSNKHNSTNDNSQQHYSTNTYLTQAYAILELKQNASHEEVKKAYRRLISRNHPDKLIAQGLPSEMIKIANDKTQKITKAYETICTAKGW